MSNSLPSPDSPDSSSLPSSYRPFSLLPTELVRTIIESTVPHHYHSTTYATRQATLRSLCLVSRLFRQIASPLLFAVVQRGNAVYNWLSDGIAARDVRPPTELIIRLVYELQPLLVQGSSLKRLTLDNVDVKVDLSSLIPLQNLAILSLSDLSLENSLSVILPTIEDLKLLQISTRSHAPILSAATFPALRALSYYSNEHDEDEPDSGISSLLANLAPQLQVLSLDASVRPELSTETAQIINHLTLFDLDVDAEDVPEVQNIRLFNIDEESDLAGMLEVLAAVVRKRNPSTHRLIYLPESPSLAWSGTEVESEFAHLNEICKEKQVEIVREEEPESWMLDSCISADFWRRRKELN